MLKPEMRKVFEELVQKYRNITIELINELMEEMPLFDVLEAITGFGNPDTCSLCIESNKIDDNDDDNCGICYLELNGFKCDDEDNYETYKKIAIAGTPENLLKAVNARADHIEKLLLLDKEK